MYEKRDKKPYHETGPQPAKIFGGAKPLLATNMTSSMCSQPWCNFFAMISSPTLVEEPFA